MQFDPKKANMRGPYMFPRFVVDGPGQPLSSLNLSADEPIVLVERGEERIGFRLDHLAYHHLASGRLAGEPYAVSF